MKNKWLEDNSSSQVIEDSFIHDFFGDEGSCINEYQKLSESFIREFNEKLCFKIILKKNMKRKIFNRNKKIKKYKMIRILNKK